MSENLAAFYIGLNFIKDFDEKEKNIVYTVGTLQNLVSCYLGKNVIYEWMDSMFENHKFLYKNGGGKSQYKWGKITASCSPKTFKNNMLALADNVLIFEKEQVPAFKDSIINNAVNLQFGKRGSSIYLTNLKGYVLTTNKKNSYLAVIPAENVIFAVFFQMKTSPSIDLNTFEIRVFINADTTEKNVIAKIQKVNGIETIEASMTHALQLQYYKVKMNEASIQNPKKVRNSMGFLISGNQSIPFSNKGLISKTNAKPTKAVNNPGTDEEEIYQSDDSMEEVVLTETKAHSNSVNNESTKEKREEKANKKPKPSKDLDDEQLKLAAYFVGLYFIKEYNKDKKKKVQISTDTLKGIVCEAIGQNVDYNFMTKMFENHKYLFKNMGCSSKCTWGNVTSACDMTEFPVYLLALADNAIIVDICTEHNELMGKPTLEWGKRGKNYYLFKIRGLVLELPKKNNYLILLPIDRVSVCFYFLMEENIQDFYEGLADVDVGICTNPQKNLIVRVLNVNGKKTEEAVGTPPHLQFYKDGMSCAGLLIESQTRNSKGFLISKHSYVTKKKIPESIANAKGPKISHLSKDNAREEHDQSQQVNQKKTDIAEIESDEIYQSDESPSPTFVEETNAVDKNIDAGTENDLAPPVCEDFDANDNDMNQTTEENNVEDDFVFPEDANADNTAAVQENVPLNNPDIEMRSDETVGATSSQGSKKKPKRIKTRNCDMIVYEREVLIALQTCELSLTKPVNLPDECIVRENYDVVEQPKKLNPPPDYVVDNRIVQIKMLQNEEKNLRKRILKLQSELCGNVAVHSQDPSRETNKNANEGNIVITEANNERDKNNCTVEDVPSSTSESNTATIEVVEDNSGLNLPTDTYKTCAGNKISVTQTIIECLDWKEVSSTEVEGVKEIEVEIRGKLKIKSSQEVLAMKDLRTDVILNFNN